MQANLQNNTRQMRQQRAGNEKCEQRDRGALEQSRGQVVMLRAGEREGCKVVNERGFG